MEIEMEEGESKGYDEQEINLATWKGMRKKRGKGREEGGGQKGGEGREKEEEKEGRMR